jgi:hypothetical protein
MIVALAAFYLEHRVADDSAGSLFAHRRERVVG